MTATDRARRGHATRTPRPHCTPPRAACSLSPSQILEKTRDSFYRAWGIGFLVWFPVQIINLHYVPPHFNAVVVSVVNVGWKTTLSLLNHYHDYGTGATRKSVKEEARVAPASHRRAPPCTAAPLPRATAARRRAPPTGAASATACTQVANEIDLLQGRVRELEAELSASRALLERQGFFCAALCPCSKAPRSSTGASDAPAKSA
jgi:hypothetical protein